MEDNNKSIKEYINEDMELRLNKDQSKRMNLLGRKIKEMYTKKHKKSPPTRQVEFRGQKINVNVYPKKDLSGWIEDEIITFFEL